MDNNQNTIMEARLRKAVRKAFKRLLKNIKSEPTTLVIESDNTKVDTSEETASEIRSWLFRGRQDNDRTGN